MIDGGNTNRPIGATSLPVAHPASRGFSRVPGVAGITPTDPFTRTHPQ
jgi:hypothetical protein